MKRSSPIVRRTRLRPLSPKRAAGRDAWRHISALVQAREGSHCARCNTHAPIGYGAPHHRRKKGQGGADDAMNLVWCCTSCNTGWIEENPAIATRMGWTVPAGVTPQEWPVWTTRYGVEGWHMPTQFGWEKAVPHPRQTEAA